MKTDIRLKKLRTGIRNKSAERDDAVAAVVALMLILAVVVTCFAVYTSAYIPSLKQQSEISHAEDVQYIFSQFSAEIDSIYASGEEREYANPITLGAGNILLSPSKSSGTIEIGKEYSDVQKIQITKTISGIESVIRTVDINPVSVSYTPSFTVWEPQGISYRTGILWLTKNERETPAALKVFSTEEGKQAEKDKVKSWLSRLPEHVRDDTNLILITVNSNPEKSAITGTGIADLHILTKKPVSFIDAVTLNTGDTFSFKDMDGNSVREVTADADGISVSVSLMMVEVSVE